MTRAVPAILLTLAAVAVAAEQGDRLEPVAVRAGRLADVAEPIRHERLVSLADELQLSVDQWLQVAAAWEVYAQQCRDLRTQHFETMVDLSAGVAAIPQRSPPGRTLRAYVRTRRRLDASIEQFDREFIDTVALVAGAAHTRTVHRFRCQRDIERIMADPLMRQWFSSGAPADLAGIAEHRQLDGAWEDEFAAYRDELVKTLKRLHEATLDMRLQWADTLDRNAAIPLSADPDDPNARPARLAIARGWTPLGRDGQAAVESYLALNRRLFERLSDSLPPDAVRPLRQRYLVDMYGTTLRYDDTVERMLETASGMVSQTEAVRATLAAALAEYRDGVTDLEDAELPIIERDRLSRLPGTPEFRTGDGEPRTSNFFAREMDLRRAALAVLKKTLSRADYRDVLRAANAAGAAHPLPGGAAAITGGVPRARPAVRMPRAPLITTADLAAWAGVLGLTATQSEALRALHDAYLAGLNPDTLRGPATLKLGFDRRVEPDGRIRVGEATPDEVDAALRVVIDARQHVDGADERLILTLADLLDPAQLSTLWLIRLDRRSSVVTTDLLPQDGLSSRRPTTSLGRLLADPSPKTLGVIEPLLPELLDALDRIEKQRLESWHAYWQYKAWSDRSLIDEEATREHWDERRRHATEALSRAQAELVRLREAAVAAMDRADPECNPGEAYRAAAFPRVHQWHAGLNGRLAALARLEPEAPIVAYAVAERAALLEEVMTVQRRWDETVWTGDATTQARLRLQMQQLRFDQDQLDSQVNAALRSPAARSPIRN